VLEILNNNTEYYYSIKKWSFQPSNPDDYLNKILRVARTRSDVGICKINPTRTLLEYSDLKKNFGEQHEVKIYFTDGSWLLLRRQSQKLGWFDAILETKTNKKKRWWMGKKYHLNREDCLLMKAKEFVYEIEDKKKF
jgi:hypothetical protein